MQKYKARGFKVSPRKRIDIKRVAQSIRDQLSVKGKLNILALFEVLQSAEVFDVAVVENLNVEAVTYPDKDLIEIRQDIYQGAVEGNGHCRFTLAHELGHFLLHRGESGVGFARANITTPAGAFEDSEWQADEFASELLIDSRELTGTETALEISLKFGTSEQAANYKLYKMKKS